MGLLTCGECDGAITAQFAHGHGGTYRYYRCTKKLGKCSQRYLCEDLLAEQLKSRLQNVALGDDWAEKMKAQIDIWEKDNAQSAQSFAQNLDEKIKEAETKLDKLVNAFLDGSIEKETYLVKKDELIKTKIDLNKRKSDFGRKACPPYAYRRGKSKTIVKHDLSGTVTTSVTGFGRRGNNWIEPLRDWINTAHHAEKLALSNDFYEIKSLTEKIGTNRRLLSRKTEFEFVRPYDLIPKYRAFCEARPAEGGASEQQNASEFSKCLDWSERRELNPDHRTPSPA